MAFMFRSRPAEVVVAGALAGVVVLVEALVRAETGAGLFSSAALDDHTRGRVLRLLVGG